MSKVKHYINKCVSYMKNNKNVVLVAVAIIAVVITGGLIFAKKNQGFAFPSFFGKSDSQLGKAAVDYINSAGLSTTPATLVKVGEASGLVKVTIKIGTSTFDSYVTKDGKLLFPQAFDMSAASKTTAAASTNSTAQTPSPTAANIKKVSKPILEAFIVSSCPYGLQMQRAIAEAIKEAPALASSVIMRYIGSISNGQITSMHDAYTGGDESAENLRQICIRQEQPAKYWPYVSCYMSKSTNTLPDGTTLTSSDMPIGDTTACQASAGVNTSALNACVKDPSRGLAYAQKDFDEGTKYNVSGSPTLVLDGTTIDETNFGGRTADAMKTIICDASQNQPGFCSTKLNTTEAAVSFNATYATATGSASGGSTQCGAGS